MRTGMRIKLIGFLLTVFILAACTPDDVNRMNQPLVFENPSGLFHQLKAMQNVLTEEQYVGLTDAIANLHAHQTHLHAIDDFYLSLNGKTPNEIIKSSSQLLASKTPKDPNKSG